VLIDFLRILLEVFNNFNAKNKINILFYYKMFHYVDPNEELLQKKRVLQQLIKANKVDRGLGLTKPEAQKVDDLLKACEEIETQGTIVLKSLSQSILRSSTVPQDSIQRFYVAIRKGLYTLSRSTFIQTPLSDIQNLTDYRDSLTSIMVSLEDTFLLLNEELYGNVEPLKGRTLEEYKAQTGKDYRKPVPAKELRDSIDRKVDENTQILLEDESNYQKGKKIQAGLQRLYIALDGIQQEIDGLQKRIYETNELRNVFITARDRIRDQTLAVYTDARPNKDERARAYQVQFLVEQRKIDDVETSLQELEERRRQLPVTKQNIEAQLLRQEEVFNAIPSNRDVIDVQRMAPDEYQRQLFFEKRSRIVDADFSLVMKDLNIFINSLTDGLVRFKSGLSSQLSRSQVTNFRTPSQRAVASLGAGMYKDLTKGIHTRFL